MRCAKHTWRFATTMKQDPYPFRYPQPHPMRCAKHSWWYLTTKEPNPFLFRTTYLEYPLRPRLYPRMRCADPWYEDAKAISEEEPVADDLSGLTFPSWCYALLRQPFSVVRSSRVDAMLSFAPWLLSSAFRCLISVFYYDSGGGYMTTMRIRI